MVPALATLLRLLPLCQRRDGWILYFLAYSKRRNFLVKCFYLPFLAAAHRWDDSQALAREDW